MMHHLQSSLLLFLLSLLPCLAVLPRQLTIQHPHTGAPFTVTLTPQSRESGCEIYSFTFPSAMVTPSSANNCVTGELFRPLAPPAGRKAPGVLVFHVIGPGDFFLMERQQCRSLAERGATALYFHLPYYGRRGGADGPYAMFKSPDLFRQSLSQAIADTHRALDLLLAFPDVSPDHLGAVGISLGALLAANAAANDSRLSRAMMILGGGNLPDIINNQVYETQAIRKFLAKMPEPQRFSFVKELLAYDPLTLVPKLKPLAQQGRFRMICAEKDQVIPPKCSRQLAQQLSCSLRWLPNVNHYTFVAQAQSIIEDMTDFLAGNLPRPIRAPAPLEHRLLMTFTSELNALLGGKMPQQGHAHTVSGAVAFTLLNSLHLKLPFTFTLGPKQFFKLTIGPHQHPVLSVGQDATSLWLADPGRLYEIPVAQLGGTTLFNNSIVAAEDMELLHAAFATIPVSYDFCKDIFELSAQTAADGRSILKASCRTEAIPILDEPIPNTFFIAYNAKGQLKNIDVSIDNMSASIEIHRLRLDTPTDIAVFIPPIRATRLPLPRSKPFNTILNHILPLIPNAPKR